ncbi:MAG: hypothetical protein II126_05045 [Erysipelotrichaceae bacterium]|nr:hypothetical protein [Erysipelotrichaceae bacterium]
MNIMYEFEHRLLPKWILTSGAFHNDLFKNGARATLYGALKSVYENRKEEMPYKPEDFNGLNFQPDENTVVYMLKLPDPTEVPLCYRMYMFRDLQTGQTACYTIEKGTDIDGSELRFLCEWNNEGKHINYGGNTIIHMTQMVSEEVRFFFSRFRNMDDIRIPLLLGVKENGNEGIRCSKCDLDLGFDLNGLKDGDRVLIHCPQCFRIETVRYENGALKRSE